MSTDLVSVCIPSLGREAKLKRLLELIPATAEWPHEVIVKYDSWPPANRGCPTVLAECVAEAKGSHICYIGNDCLPQQGWLRIAMEAMAKWFPERDGLVVLNDGYWKGELPLHFVISRKLIDQIGGHVFHPGYHHCCSDSEFGGRTRALAKYVWCKEAHVYHDHPIQHGMDEVAMDDVYRLAYDPVRRQEDCDLLLARAKEFKFRIRENFGFPRIPRRLFTIWLGDAPMPDVVKKCVESHRKWSKGWDYQVLTENPGLPYVDAALKARNWVKAADYLRMWQIYQYGGIYLDADMELLYDLDEMLPHSAFACREENGFVSNAAIGAEPAHPAMKTYLARVDAECDPTDREHTFHDGMGQWSPVAYRYSSLGKLTILPSEVFIPYDHQSGKINVTENTLTYHHFLKSWT